MLNILQHLMMDVFMVHSKLNKMLMNLCLMTSINILKLDLKTLITSSVKTTPTSKNMQNGVLFGNN